jgi:hypothetical protein
VEVEGVDVGRRGVEAALERLQEQLDLADRARMAARLRDEGRVLGGVASLSR